MSSIIETAIEHLSLSDGNVAETTAFSRRSATEQFIRRVFADAYGADIQQFMPLLLCLRDSDNQTYAALGMRPGVASPLFLETYLDRPVEQVLSHHFGQAAQRDEVIEIGNLAVTSRGAVRPLIAALTALLHAAKYRWVVFTIGPMLANSFARLGLPLTDLGAAKPERLSKEELASWGSYYEQRPRVMAGRLSDAYPFLQRQCLKEQALTQLWHQAERVGRRAA